MRYPPFETLTLEIQQAIAVLTLRRPEKLNCFTARMHEELRAAFDDIERAVNAPRPVRALVLTGAGRAFCAGQDLSERRPEKGQEPPDLGRSLRANYNPLIERIAKLPIPVIAAVNGVAAGAGANLALACDIVIAARSAKFLQSFSRVGLIPDAGGTWMLPRLIGMALTKGLTFLGESLSAEQALQWGLIWQVVDDEQLMASVLVLAQRLSNQPTRSFALQKQALAASAANTLVQQLELEATLQAEAGRTQDFAEGVSAFLQQRDPVFRGR